MADPNKDLFDWLENSVGGYILRRQRFGVRHSRFKSFSLLLSLSLSLNDLWFVQRIEQAPPSMEAFFEFLRARRCYELKNNPPTVLKDRLVKLRVCF